ncbi:MAG: hypothetical protein WC367_07120 [Methanoregula sp.]|jgi:hypothetical protein
MGDIRDVMHDHTAREIQNIYSGYEGWASSLVPVGNGNDTIVTLERQNGGHRDVVNVLVTYARTAPAVFPGDRAAKKRAADGTLLRQEYAILVPKNADVSAVPAGVKIHFMHSFVYEGDELVWVKKPVRRTEAAPQKAEV